MHPLLGNSFINAIGHALVTVRGDRISLLDLPPEIRDVSGTTASPAGVLVEDRDEERRVREALEASGWNRSKAAERLGVSRVTLWKKMRALGLGRRSA
jgi:transcriptional regulator of acetoin/glycerol metabolism